MSQLDITNTFLHGNIPEDYMQVPQRLEVYDNRLVCKLNKSLYGFK